MFENFFHEEILAVAQNEPPLAQLEAISYCPVAGFLGEETDPHMATALFQVVVESNTVSPDSPFLQAEHLHLPQPTPHVTYLRPFTNSIVLLWVLSNTSVLSCNEGLRTGHRIQGDIEGGIEGTLSSIAEDMELCGAIDMLEARDTIQKDLYSLEWWVSSNLTGFSKTQCKVLQLGQGNHNPKVKAGQRVD
ncbi:hypothetical protein HGM15179_007312 [Zosterops borbonicus]|uniref:Uncharacterized protein n=1 Tax=Zosterops borbonicus TaxID=364589 RepID=A0A8K1GLB9_9PASS|nr:hypothetical protein HGM15179_007312 [Zosterops borbonicus]